jgi:adenylate cyclase
LAIAALFGGLIAVMTMLYHGLIPLLVTAFISLLMYVGTSFLMIQNTWQPSALIIAFLFVTGLFTYVFKYLVVERKRRIIKTAFGLFLSEQLVHRLIAEDKSPTLGGEIRQITVMFADLSGYTELSGKISPTDLMTTTNEYLEIMAGEIERSGGYIDKFIGDEIMAFWGAPAHDPFHAKRAIETSVRIIELVEAKQIQDKQSNRPGFGIKIALNSGEAVIGNIGTRNRMNYSAVGETVNIAARFEEYASQNGRRLVIGHSTLQSADGFPGGKFVEEVMIRGVAKPVEIFSIEGFE